MTTHLRHHHQSQHCCHSHLHHGSSACLAASGATLRVLSVRHRIWWRTALRKHTLCKPIAHTQKRENVPPGASPVAKLLLQLRVAQLLRHPQAWEPPIQAAPPSRRVTRRRDGASRPLPAVARFWVPVQLMNNSVPSV